MKRYKVHHVSRGSKTGYQIYDTLREEYLGKIDDSDVGPVLETYELNIWHEQGLGHRLNENYNDGFLDFECHQ